MVGSQLPDPILSITLDAIEKIQGGEESVSALWTVFSRVKDAVENGHRLENMSWRLWHCVRLAPKRKFSNSLSAHLPSLSKALQRPFSSPSLSFSSSSDGTATSSDWDRDTAVGEDDDVHALHASGARRTTVVSPRLDKPRLTQSGTFTQAPANTGPALLSHRSHQLNTGHDVGRQLPFVAPEHPPHHQPPANTNTGADERAQDFSLEVSLHHRANRSPTVAGLKAPSSPHVSISSQTYPSHLPNSIPTSNISSHLNHPNHATAASRTSSSMPIALPSLVRPRKETISIGRIIADLFPGENPGGTVHCTNGKLRSYGVSFSGVSGRIAAPIPMGQPILPLIIEPRPSTPAAGRTWASDTPSSTATSATSTPRQMFPTVVVVNPTPHPTPPATPSSDISENPYGLKPTVDCLQSVTRGWNGAVNGQLATPVSMNGDKSSLSPGEPKFVMIGPKPLKEFPQFLNVDITALSLQTSLLPAAEITLPERPIDNTTLHPITPSSNPHSEIINSKSTTAPIPAPVPAEDKDKKFYLAAPHSSSGHESSESPDTFDVGSASPQKPAPMEVRDRVQAVLSREREEIASSFSAGSPGGRPPSVASSRGGRVKHKGRVGFNAGGGSRRRQGGSKMISVGVKPGRKDADLQAKEAETATESRSRNDSERKQSKEKEKEKGKGKGKEKEKEKEKEVDEKSDILPAGPSTFADQLATPSLKAQHKHQSHRTATPSQQPQNLRQLPTNPPRQQAQPPVRPTPEATTSRTNTSQLYNTRLPLHPLGNLGLAHLPTVPPRLRRPIEITETSSDYETTDTDESSWESGSPSGEEHGEGERPRSSRTLGDRRSRKSNMTTRTRDAGEFQRDAEREAQRARELFQKLPTRSYSHLGQLPRTKSGLSMLFKPDPELFPEGHPYRTSHSSRDILARNWSAPAPPRVMAAMAGRSVAAGATVSAQSVMASVSAGPSSPRHATGSQSRNGYRRRGPPQGQEHESDSGDEDPEDAIQVSSSVAQRRLAAIMGQRSAAHLRSPSRVSPNPVPPAITRTTTAPVLMHPYLPDPAPLQTPHTVRRNIIVQELDEELRRNLLWERSQNQIQGRPPRAAGSILPGPWRPLATMRPEEGREAQSNPSDKGPGKRPFATQRTKSWAGEYHAEGW